MQVLFECPRPSILPESSSSPAAHHVQSAVSGCPPGTILPSSAIYDQAQRTGQHYSREAFKYALNEGPMSCIGRVVRNLRIILPHPLNGGDKSVCDDCHYAKSGSGSCIILFEGSGILADNQT